MTGIEMIAKERSEQIEKHGWTLAHDLEHEKDGALRELASALSGVDATFSLPWGECRDIKKHLEPLAQKVLAKPHVERLVIAGALLAAEIDRMVAVMASPEYIKYRNAVAGWLLENRDLKMETRHEDAVFLMFDAGKSIGYCINELLDLEFDEPHMMVPMQKVQIQGPNNHKKKKRRR